jgi:hypothetical protein
MYVAIDIVDDTPSGEHTKPEAAAFELINERSCEPENIVIYKRTSYKVKTTVKVEGRD